MIVKQGFWKVAALVLLATACATSSPSTVAGISHPSPSNTTLSSPSPTPTALSCHPCLALVTLRGSDHVVVRDITDIKHPRTVSTLGTLSAPRFISATELSMRTGAGWYRTPLSGSPRTPVAAAAAGAGGAAWSPDGTAVVYTTTSGPEYPATLQVHLLRAGVDRILASMPAPGPYGCESIASCVISIEVESRLEFSPDGSVISMVFNGPGVSAFRLWTSAGDLVLNNDSHGAMAAWSGQSLYFDGSKGIEAWRDGVVSTFLAHMAWFTPSSSPSGGQIAFTMRDSNGWGHVRVVDLATKKIREIKAARSDAVFLTSRYIWYRGERACTAAEQCGAHPPFHPESGKTYIYDLEDRTETESIVTGVVDVWPRAA